MLLLRRPTFPNVHHHLLLLSRFHLHALDPDPTVLWIAKVVSTVFLLSPSRSAATVWLTPLRRVISPSVAFEAVRRLSNPKSALDLFNLTWSEFHVTHSAAAHHHVITLLCCSGLHVAALKVFDQMTSDGHSPEVSFLEFLLYSCAKAGEFDASIRLLTRASEFRCWVRSYTFNNLLNLMVSRNRVQDAVFLFENHLGSRIFTPDTCSFNVIIKGCCRLGDIDKAFQLFKEMEDFGCSPDTITHNVLIDGLCKANKVDRWREILREVQSDSMCLPNVVTYTAIISGYCKLGKMEDASEVFNEMVGLGIRPSRVTYNVLIDGYGKASDMPSAVLVHERMLASGCPPDIVTFTSLIDGYCRSGQLDDAMKLWHDMGKRQIRLNVYTFAIVINSLCKKNRLCDARVILKELNRRKDIVAHAFIYNPVIDGFCKAGDVEEANSILVEMEEKGCSPDKFTYTILIIGHCMKGRMLEAIDLFNRMVATGCDPDSITVSSLISCLLKAGMPMEVKRIMVIASGKDLGLDVSPFKEIPSSLTKSVDVSVAV